jgi:hypothetical protein
MSEQDEGFGGNAGPTLEYESDFANEFSNVSATGDQSWARTRIIRTGARTPL